MSEALKSNTTLIKINLSGEHKKEQHTNDIQRQSGDFHSH